MLNISAKRPSVLSNPMTCYEIWTGIHSINSYNSLMRSGTHIASEGREISVIPSNSSGSHTKNASVKIWHYKQEIHHKTSYMKYMTNGGLLFWHSIVACQTRLKTHWLKQAPCLSDRQPCENHAEALNILCNWNETWNTDTGFVETAKRGIHVKSDIMCILGGKE